MVVDTLLHTEQGVRRGSLTSLTRMIRHEYLSLPHSEVRDAPSASQRLGMSLGPAAQGPCEFVLESWFATRLACNRACLLLATELACCLLSCRALICRALSCPPVTCRPGDWAT